MSGIETVGVVGAGFMGTGIAETAARAGLTVIVHEPGREPLTRSEASIQRSVGSAVRRGRLDDDAAAALLGRVSWTTEVQGLAAADLVVEAVAEDVDVKRSVFAALDGVLADHALIASNTSSIPIAELAAATTRPEQVLGLHFFSPVPVMDLVEIVVALQTSDRTAATAEAFAATVGKHAVKTKDRAGFIVNMLLIPYLMAAVRMYEEGFSSREDIDEGMKRGCGHPMGPLTLCDFIGLDVLNSVCNSLYDEFKRTEYAPPPLLRRMVASGWLGRKAGRGFYEYA